MYACVGACVCLLVCLLACERVHGVCIFWQVPERVRFRLTDEHKHMPSYTEKIAYKFKHAHKCISVRTLCTHP